MRARVVLLVSIKWARTCSEANGSSASLPRRSRAAWTSVGMSLSGWACDRAPRMGEHEVPEMGAIERQGWVSTKSLRWER